MRLKNKMGLNISGQEVATGIHNPVTMFSIVVIILLFVLIIYILYYISQL